MLHVRAAHRKHYDWRGSDSQRSTDLFSERFPYPDGSVPVDSPTWNVTSGTLAVKGNIASTSSPVFRAVTRQADFADVHLSAAVRIRSMSSTPTTPAMETDGVHLMLRYESQYSLYYASVLRRDGDVIIKRKCPGGPSNGGTYHDLGNPVHQPWNAGAWQDAAASVRNNADGSVTVSLFREGILIASGADAGFPASADSPQCFPIRVRGPVGLRADNADIEFDDFGVSAL